MSACGWLIRLSCVPLALTSLALGGAPQSQPAATVKEAKSAAATRPASIGSIPEAMRHLATIPRPKTAREASAASSQNRTRTKDLPYSKVLPSAEPGSPPVVDRRERAMRLASSERSSRTPSVEEMRRAFPDTEFPAGMGTSDAPAVPPGTGAWAPYGYESEPTGPRVSGTRRDFANYRYFGGQPSRYGYGYHGYGAGDATGDAYRYGYMEGYNYGYFYDESNARTDIVLKHYSGHLAKALELFNRGQYHEAADSFQLAADTHQGDPAARLYTAHALFAVGRYRDAIPFLRRAYELQPRFVFLGFDIRDDYGRRADFDTHLAALCEAQRQAPANLDRMVLLGYVLYFSHQRDKAYDLLKEANRLRPGDPFITALLDNSRPPDVMLETISNR